MDFGVFAGIAIVVIIIRFLIMGCMYRSTDEQFDETKSMINRLRIESEKVEKGRRLLKDAIEDPASSAKGIMMCLAAYQEAYKNYRVQYDRYRQSIFQSEDTLDNLRRCRNYFDSSKLMYYGKEDEFKDIYRSVRMTEFDTSLAVWAMAEIEKRKRSLSPENQSVKRIQ